MSNKLVKHEPIVISQGQLFKPKQKPLTVKLMKGIEVYARAKAISADSGMVNVTLLITATLDAYRMENEKLFNWLDKNRYRWNSSHQVWQDLRRE
jgi:predicted DCC family thiol-disulfide oxidoreductase YuxK